MLGTLNNVISSLTEGNSSWEHIAEGNVLYLTLNGFSQLMLLKLKLKIKIPVPHQQS
jgi:hypothetical protein